MNGTTIIGKEKIFSLRITHFCFFLQILAYLLPLPNDMRQSCHKTMLILAAGWSTLLCNQEDAKRWIGLIEYLFDHW